MDSFIDVLILWNVLEVYGLLPLFTIALLVDHFPVIAQLISPGDKTVGF